MPRGPYSMLHAQYESSYSLSLFLQEAARLSNRMHASNKILFITGYHKSFLINRDVGCIHTIRIFDVTVTFFITVKRSQNDGSLLITDSSSYSSSNPSPEMVSLLFLSNLRSLSIWHMIVFNRLSLLPFFDKEW